MNRGIYATATGMTGLQRQLDVITHNLANANTVGYKQENIAFDEAMLTTLYANGGEGQSIGTLGAGPTEQVGFLDLRSGNLQTTGNPLDVAILDSDGEIGMFAIQTDQGVRYTRNGSFTLSKEGLLATPDGHPVLDDTGRTIEIPAGRVEIQADGTIQSIEGTVGTDIAKIGLFRGTWVRQPNGLYNTDQAEPLAEFELVSGSLETSNVNPVESMIQLIKLNRSFEMAQRQTQQQDELMQRLMQALDH